MYNLDELWAVAGLDGVKFRSIVQCELGAETSKPTDLMHYLLEMSTFPLLCTHPPRWWALPWMETVDAPEL